MRSFRLAAAFLVVLFTTGSLVTGAPWLTWTSPLLFNIPFGNLLTWGGLVCLAWLPYLLSPAGSWSRRLSIVALVVAASWFPVSWWLFGNVNLSGGVRYIGGEGWILFTGFTVLFPLLLLGWRCAMIHYVRY